MSGAEAGKAAVRRSLGQQAYEARLRSKPRTIGGAPVLPVVLIVTGAYLAWFGVHYWRSTVKWPSDPVKALLQGKKIPDASKDTAAANAITALFSSSATTASAETVASVGAGTNAIIATTAMKYVGQGYTWGGPADRPGHWDCSSFVSYVLGHDLGLPLPGGKWGDPGYPPHSHGPTTTSYKLYGTPINRKDVSAGDLVVWPTHIGIAISNSQMVSARSASSHPPTGVNTIDGHIPGEIAVYRRVKGVTSATGGVFV